MCPAPQCRPSSPSATASESGNTRLSLVNTVFTRLSLVSGFTEMTGDSNKENVVSLSNSGAGVTPKKSSSVPLGMDGAGQGPAHQHQGSSSKKRKLFTQSLGKIIRTCFGSHKSSGNHFVVRLLEFDASIYIIGYVSKYLPTPPLSQPLESL